MGDLHMHLREIHQIGDDTPERLVTAARVPALAEQGLLVVGVSDIGRGYRMSRPRPPTAHLLASLDGEGEAAVEGRWQRCPAGSVYLSPARVPMAFQPIVAAKRTERWRVAWVYFTAASGTDVIAGPATRLIEGDGQPLAWAIEGLHRESSSGSPPDQVARWADLVAVCARRLAAPVSAGDPLWRLWADVEAHLAEPWTLERLCQRCGREPESLRRLTLETVGLSPMRHVARLRMRRAQALLRTTGGKVAAVAAAVGYGNAFAFSAAFKRVVGVSPDRYRRG